MDNRSMYAGFMTPQGLLERTEKVMSEEPTSMGACRESLENAEQEVDSLRERKESLEACFEETIGFLNDLLKDRCENPEHLRLKIRGHLIWLRDSKLFSFQVLDKDNER